MKTAFVFSGQGSQYTGMASDFYESFPIVRQVFEEASDALKADLKKICFEQDERLHFTPFTQPAVLTVSYAIETLMKKEGLSPDAVGGLSLGEYTALLSSNVFSFRDAVSLVHKRGSFMEEAVPNGIGKMAAVIGLKKEQVEDICKSVSPSNYVTIANYNTPNQLVISGTAAGVEAAAKKAEESGAKRVVELNVSGPFHSRLLESAAELFHEEIQNTPIHSFKYPVYSNVTASPYPDTESVPSLLTSQITTSVKFEQMITQMISDGVQTFIELGPGKTLRSFIKSIDKNVTVKNVEKVSQFNKVLEVLNR